MQTVTITRHWFGAFKLVFLGGLTVVALVFGGTCYPDAALTPIAYGIAAIITLITLIALRTYYLSKVELSRSGIKYTYYTTMFTPNVAEADWNAVQSASYKQPSLIASLLGYGTLLVQTADERPDLTAMAYIPRVTYWRGFIDDRANLEGSPDATV